MIIRFTIAIIGFLQSRKVPAWRLLRVCLLAGPAVLIGFIARRNVGKVSYVSDGDVKRRLSVMLDLLCVTDVFIRFDRLRVLDFLTLIDPIELVGDPSVLIERKRGMCIHTTHRTDIFRLVGSFLVWANQNRDTIQLETVTVIRGRHFGISELCFVTMIQTLGYRTNFVYLADRRQLADFIGLLKRRTNLTLVLAEFPSAAKPAEGGDIGFNERISDLARRFSDCNVGIQRDGLEYQVFDISELSNHLVVNQSIRNAERNGAYWANWIMFAIGARGQ